MAADPLLPFPSAKAGPVFISSHVTTTDGTLFEGSAEAAAAEASAATARVTSAVRNFVMGMLLVES
jgi:hypothetical protein